MSQESLGLEDQPEVSTKSSGLRRALAAGAMLMAACSTTPDSGKVMNDATADFTSGDMSAVLDGSFSVETDAACNGKLYIPGECDDKNVAALTAKVSERLCQIGGAMEVGNVVGVKDFVDFGMLEKTPVVDLGNGQLVQCGTVAQAAVCSIAEKDSDGKVKVVEAVESQLADSFVPGTLGEYSTLSETSGSGKKALRVAKDGEVAFTDTTGVDGTIPFPDKAKCGNPAVDAIRRNLAFMQQVVKKHPQE